MILFRRIIGIDQGADLSQPISDRWSSPRTCTTVIFGHVCWQWPIDSFPEGNNIHHQVVRCDAWRILRSLTALLGVIDSGHLVFGR